MEAITIRIPDDLLKSLDGEADEYSRSRSEHIRRLIEKGREFDDLRERLESREDRIDELEEQLAKRSQLEEKIEELPDRIDEPAPPWPVRWVRWARGSA
jgi:predicted transcriptional regulator